MHKYVELAKKTIEEYIRTGKAPSVPENLDEDMKERRAVFVSIKKDSCLRGCIGTIEPCYENLAQEIIQNAVSASTRDPRFPEITSDELDKLSISVDVLTLPERINSPDELNPKKYGVIVQSGFKRGLLLPDLEGVDTIECQVAIAMQKACIYENEPVELYRFEVKRYH